jgi:hypothetical protein
VSTSDFTGEAVHDRRRHLARLIASGRVDAPLEGDLREFARTEGVLPLLEWMGGGLATLRASAAVQLARSARLARVLDRLAGEGVTAIVFKGAHLAYACYPDPALRPHVDTDLLIRPEDAVVVQRVFERTGHQRLPHVSGRFVLPQFHYIDGSVGGAHAYDVHWQIATPIAFRDRFPFDEVRAEAVRLPAFGPNGLGPSLPHALLFACVHRAAHHGASDRLIWLLDVRLLLRSASQTQIEEFCRRADVAGLNAVCHDACARAAALFGDVSVPAALRARAEATAEPSRAYLDAPSSLKQLWLDLRALEAWRDRGVLLREHLFPPASYMRAAFPSGRPLAWAYAARLIGGAWTRRAR